MNNFSIMKIILSISLFLSLVNFTAQQQFLAEENFQDYDLYVFSLSWGSKNIFQILIKK